VLVLVLVVFGRIPGEGRWVSDLNNAAHGPAFMIVTLCVFVLLSRSSGRRISIFAQYSVAILISILLGALVELLQYFTDRDATLTDLWTDTLGTLAATGGLLAFDPRLPGSPGQAAPRRIGLLVAIAASLLMLAPLVTTAAAYLKRHFAFPTLVDFSLPLATSFIRVDASASVARVQLPRELRSDGRGSIGLRTRLTEKSSWVLVLSEPVRDWRGFTRLNLDVANPTNEPLVLRLRVFDRHGRGHRAGYRGSVEIAPHTRAIQSVPLTALNSRTGDAQTDTSNVHSIVVARASSNRAREFYLIRIWLD
jgi:hypothetical protein